MPILPPTAVSNKLDIRIQKELKPLKISPIFLRIVPSLSWPLLHPKSSSKTTSLIPNLQLMFPENETGEIPLYTWI